MAENSGNKVMVNIYGEEYPITGFSDPSYISKIADFVDTKMKATAKGSRIAARDKIAILTALSIASELFELKDEESSSENEIDERIDSLINRINKVL
jgi:cell division protein ZapA (FtsZ GTPase activity inhibitor)